MIGILDRVANATQTYLASIPKDIRKDLGQFFTGRETARFMASMFSTPKSEFIRVIDPGAGTGILTAAVAERFLSTNLDKRMHVTCYETDDRVLPILNENLTWVASCFGTRFQFEVRKTNYILSQKDTYAHSEGPTAGADMIICNPPYMKIGKTAPEAVAMPNVCYGAPNLYFLFAAMALFDLAADGEMVFIIPRSWTSGAYFRKFREYLLSEGALKAIHLFGHRDDVFKNQSVLQETMIIKVARTEEHPQKVQISNTPSAENFSNRACFDAPYKAVVSGNDRYVYLVTSPEDSRLLERVNELKYKLPDLGMKMKTGLTVDFRHRALLANSKSLGAVPLFHARHLRGGGIEFPAGITEEYIETAREGLLQPNENYLFVKRFTAKEEKRRLQCSVYQADHFPEYDRISTHNKINFIGPLKRDCSLSLRIVYGLYVLFNSSVYDTYYRLLNGSTQVNSTEVNSMPMPSLETIDAMGQQLMDIGSMTQSACDRILERYI